MIDTVVARRYANALFALGKKEEGSSPEHARRMPCRSWQAACLPGLDVTLKSPVIGVEEKKAVLDKLLGKLKADTTMRNFCFLLKGEETPF